LRGWRDRLPVVVMSIVLSVANACLAVSFKLPAPECPTECLGWLSRSIPSQLNSNLAYVSKDSEERVGDLGTFRQVT
jgi:hypothetical protein